MGEVTSTIRRKVKAKVTRDLKSNTIQNLEIKKKAFTGSSYAKVANNLIKSWDDTIKNYEKKYKKNENINKKLYNSINDCESYYKDIKAKLIICINNLDETGKKIEKHLAYYNNKMLSLSSKTGEHATKKSNMLGELEKQFDDKKLYLNFLQERLKELRDLQKNVIQKYNFITPEYLKDKLKAIQKNVLKIISDAKKGNTKNANEQLGKLLDNKKGKIILFNTLLEKASFSLKNIDMPTQYYKGGMQYCHTSIKQFVDSHDGNNKKNTFREQKSAINDLKDKQIKESKEKIEDILGPDTPQEEKLNPENMQKLTSFTLGYILQFYRELNISLKSLYSKLRDLRGEVNKLSSSTIRQIKNKAGGILKATAPGLIGIAAGITGMWEAYALVSAIAWLTAQAGYSVQEMGDVIENTFTSRPNGIEESTGIDENIKKISNLLLNAQQNSEQVT